MTGFLYLGFAILWYVLFVYDRDRYSDVMTKFDYILPIVMIVFNLVAAYGAFRGAM